MASCGVLLSIFTADCSPGGTIIGVLVLLFSQSPSHPNPGGLGMRPAQLSPSNLLGYSIPTTNRHDNLQILGHMDHGVADDSHLSKTGVSVCQGVSLTNLWVVESHNNSVGGGESQ